jgi:hypothetical protein
MSSFGGLCQAPTTSILHLFPPSMMLLVTGATALQETAAGGGRRLDSVCRLQAGGKGGRQDVGRFRATQSPSALLTLTVFDQSRSQGRLRGRQGAGNDVAPRNRHDTLAQIADGQHEVALTAWVAA